MNQGFKMCLYLSSIAVAVFGIWLTDTVNAGYIPASSDPCQIGGLNVAYEGEKFVCGVEVPLDFNAPATVTLTSERAKEGIYYTLVMVDPDAPSNTEAYWLHWLVVNIDAQDFESGRIQGDEIMAYAPPSPPRGGPHRYQFFAFEQHKTLPDADLEGTGQRGGFDLDNFKSSYDLDGPIAGFQFLTRREA